MQRASMAKNDSFGLANVLANLVGLQVDRIRSQISGAHRSSRPGMLAAAASAPLAWLLGLLCVASVIQYDSHQEPIYSPHTERPQYLYTVRLCSPPSLVGQLRCVASSQQQHQHQLQHQKSVVPLGSVSLAAVAAHPGDLGFAVAVFLPQLLLLLLVAKVVVRLYANKAAASSNVNVADAAAGGEESNSNERTTAAAASSSWAVHHLCDFGPAGAATFLAVAKLLPLVCSLLTAVTGWLGLRQQHPTAQALQLLHPFTPVVAALMTLLSQASNRAHGCACSVSVRMAVGAVAFVQ